MLIEKLESVKPVEKPKFSISRVVVLYVLGTVALIATVFFLLNAEDTTEYVPQFGILEARR